MFDGISTASMLAKAVAFAEGCIDIHENYHKLSLPYRLNNPCDLKVTNSHFTSHMHPSGKLMFADIGTGWNAGAYQMELMLTNKSHIYNNSMTIQEVANHYAKEHETPLEQHNANDWAKYVALFLRVQTTTKLIELINKPVGGATSVFPSSPQELQQIEAHNEEKQTNEQKILDDVSKAATTKSSFASKFKKEQ